MEKNDNSEEIKKNDNILEENKDSKELQFIIEEKNLKENSINAQLSNYQPKFIWKNTYLDGILPFTKYNKNLQLNIDGLNQNQSEAAKIQRELRKGAAADNEVQDAQQTITKVTIFSKKGQTKESIIQHKKYLEEKQEKKQQIIAENQGLEKENKEEENGEEEQEENEEKLEDEEEDLDEDENEDVPINEYIFLIDEQKFAFVKSQNDENLFECIIKNKPSPFKSNHSNLDQTQILKLAKYSKKHKSNDQSDQSVYFSKKIKLKVRVIVSQEKKGTVELTINTNDKAMQIAEQIANLFGETKYSISFFENSQKINLNEKIAELGLGYFQNTEKDTKSQESRQNILCLKGGVDAPKVFHRFKQVDAPERGLSYIADEEAYDAISFIPNKDIKFAGFSVYQVFQDNGESVDFKCLYKIKLGADSWPEKMMEFKIGDVDVNTKMVDIMLPAEILVQKGKQIVIGVRFIAGEDFFCKTYLGYGGEDYKRIKHNEECIFDVLETEDCTKGETDVTFGQIPRIHYFDSK